MKLIRKQARFDAPECSTQEDLKRKGVEHAQAAGFPFIGDIGGSDRDIRPGTNGSAASCAGR
jgi:hypothetical protein